jgi:UDP:flavonoid glycosyltransferase YjiC (YdhE family)
VARLTISTVGSAGDVLPLVRPAAALRDRGHEVRFAVSPDLAPLVASAGFEAVPAGPPMRLAEDAGLQRMLTLRRGGLESAERLVRDWLAPSLAPTFRDLRAACAGSDALVASTSQLAAPWVARALGLPWLTVSVQPLAIPSRHVTPPPLLGARRRLTVPALNALRWRAARLGLRRLDRFLLPAARELGLPPIRDALVDGALSPWLVAVLSSPRYTPCQPDWPAQVRVTGFTLWDGGPLGRDVASFLDAGDPPVVVTLGSSASLVAGGFFEAAAAAVRGAGRRCLLIVGHERLVPARAPAGCLAVVSAPLPAVLRGSAALVHHGGFGSTAAALSAGAPQLVVPWAFDQPFHAQRVQELGCGRSLRRWTAGRLRRELEALLGGDAYRPRAASLAADIAGEDGPGAAADAIEGALAAG